MRHSNIDVNETPLETESMYDRPSRTDVTPEAIDTIILRARQMRSDRTAQLLSRLGAVLARPFRQWALSRHVGADAAIKGQPHGAL